MNCFVCCFIRSFQYPEPNRPWPGSPSPAPSPGPGGHPLPPASPHQQQQNQPPPPSSPSGGGGVHAAPSPSPQPSQASPSPHQVSLQPSFSPRSINIIFSFDGIYWSTILFIIRIFVFFCVPSTRFTHSLPSHPHGM